MINIKRTYYSFFETSKLILPVVIASILAYILTLVDYFWVKHISINDTALLALINGSIVAFLFLLSKSFDDVATAIFSKSGKKDFSDLFIHALLVALLVSVGVCVLLNVNKICLLKYLSHNHLVDLASIQYYQLVVLDFL